MTQIFDGIEFKGITSKSLSIIAKDLGRRQRAEELTYRYEVLDSSTDYIEHTDNFKPYTRKMEFHIIDPNRKDEIFQWLKGYGVLKTIKENKPTKNLLLNSDKELNNPKFISVDVYDALKDHIGETITVSFDMKTSVLRDIRVYPYQDIGTSILDSKLFKNTTANTYERFSFTTKVKDYGLNPRHPINKGIIGWYDQVGEQSISVRNIDIRLGNYVNSKPYEKHTDETNGYFKASVISTLEVEDNIGLDKFKVDFLINPPFMYLDSGLTPVTVTSGSKINNPGTYKAEPIIHIVGSGNINLTVNGKTSIITGLVSEIYINTELQHCYNGTSDLDGLYKGDYHELLPGNNTISWSGGTITKVEVIPNWRNL